MRRSDEALFTILPKGESHSPVSPIDQVLNPISETIVSGEVSPLSLLLKEGVVGGLLASHLGLSLEEVRRLDREGILERTLSNDMYAVSSLALAKIVEMMSQGLLDADQLVKLATELPKVAHKVSGKEVQKHLVLDADKLEELLTQPKVLEEK